MTGERICEENQFHLKTFPSSEDQSQQHLTTGAKDKRNHCKLTFIRVDFISRLTRDYRVRDD